MTLEVILVPVSGVERAKEFHRDEVGRHGPPHRVPAEPAYRKQ
ncbi:hypothetical protein ACIPSA_02145 [Streptomyces sp. NPDC086549]